MTVLASPVSQWRDRASAGGYERMYWHYDATLGEWTLTNNRLLESGRLVDVNGDGEYELVLLADLPAGPTLAAARVSGGDTIIY